MSVVIQNAQQLTEPDMAMLLSSFHHDDWSTDSDEQHALHLNELLPSEPPTNAVYAMRQLDAWLSDSEFMKLKSMDEQPDAWIGWPENATPVVDAETALHVFLNTVAALEAFTEEIN